jgi:putative tryptophan/tyrosine transport system substrate-binding protein
MRRREFISALGGAVAWPVAARGEQSALPIIGFLSAGSADSIPPNFFAAFRQGLDEAGYVEGRNVVIEYSFADSQYERLPALATELVRRPVALIVTSGAPAAPAAKAATTTIPIVLLFAGDPVAAGLVASLNRPGGNVTGMSFIIAELGAKKLGLLRELVPRAATIAVLVNPTNPPGEAERDDIEAAARVLGQQLQIFDWSGISDFELISAGLVQHRVGALLVGSDPFFVNRRKQIVSLATRHGIPALYPLREFVADGGLMSYGTSVADAYRQGGVYAGRILKGAKPADLPVVQPTKFELVINLKTAKLLGLTVPPTLLARADEVIE